MKRIKKNEKFGKLTAVQLFCDKWFCYCSCGNKDVQFKSEELRSGDATQCIGCKYEQNNIPRERVIHEIVAEKAKISVEEVLDADIGIFGYECSPVYTCISNVKPKSKNIDIIIEEIHDTIERCRCVQHIFDAFPVKIEGESVREGLLNLIKKTDEISDKNFTSYADSVKRNEFETAVTRIKYKNELFSWDHR